MRSPQTQAGSLNLIFRETGSHGSKRPQVLVELRECRPVGTGDVASLAAKPPVILLAPEVLAGGKAEGWQETEIDRGRRTAKQLNVGFSVTALTCLASLPACLRDWQSPQPTVYYPRQGCRIILTASERQPTW